MLTRIKNAQAARRERVAMPFSKVKFHIANLLKEAGYVGEVERVKRTAVKSEQEWLDLTLKYDDARGAISGIRIVSRPSRHIYTRASDIRPVRSGFGTAVVSTSHGIMTSHQAKKANVGGEIMFEIW